MATSDENPNRQALRLRCPRSRRRQNSALRAQRMLMERSRLKLDILALLVFFASVFLALSLVSYNPADPPSTLVWPGNARVHNLCGDRKSTRLNSSHIQKSRMPSSA